MASEPSAPASRSSLRSSLAAVLPKDKHFGVYHLSTPPQKTDALCSAPPTERPDRTYCENHFLAISIDVPASSTAPSSSSQVDSGSATKKVLVLGIEVLIYTTAHLSTLFVSKADSTGYLHLLNLKKGHSSPIKEVCRAFLRHLVASHHRLEVPNVINLFGRAQDQYLFPGSIKNGGKHVLDDRGLIKWWCRVLDPLAESSGHVVGPNRLKPHGYIVVPGLDDYETRALVPKSADGTSNWVFGHPLEQISHYSRKLDSVPPRCLIPRFPDDPKSRFRDELDEEAHQTKAMKSSGSWKSVKSLDMFWEMMAFRQECSSGRMTGFIWVVFDQIAETKYVSKEGRDGESILLDGMSSKLKDAPTDSRNADPGEIESDKKKNSQKKKKNLRGMIKVRQPRIKQAQRNYLLKTPVRTPYYYWPLEGRGERIVDEKGYKRIMESLLHLDFANLDKAVGSSQRWISEAGTGSQWGYEVTGEKEALAPELSSGTAACNGSGQVNNLSGLVKRKRSDANGGAEDGANTLNAGLVRKKAKVEEESKPEVNVLNVGLVRKKPKAD